jgi:lauroyl/myristoyl acyltransferase
MGLLSVGVYASQNVGGRGVDLVCATALAAARACLPLRMRLARTMRAAGVYRKGLVDLHLERAADQMTFLMHIFRAGFPDSGVAGRFRFDESFHHLQQAYDARRGVLVVSPHLCCYPLVPRILSDRIPCSIYLRRSREHRKHRINEAIGTAGGGHLVYPPENATRLERLTAAIRVLREGRMLFITPDLPRKADEGVPVRILGRDVHFPTGVAIMAMRTKAPIVALDWHCREGVYNVRCHEPMDLSGRGDRQRRAAAAIRRFAELMDECLRRQPEMWWNWLDKRWTKIIRGRAD